MFDAASLAPEDSIGRIFEGMILLRVLSIIALGDFPSFSSTEWIYKSIKFSINFFHSDLLPVERPVVA